jgi:tetratricopeptide (TPR) repeat protein
MAYRESAPPPAAACYRHASTQAAATCTRCLQPICEICFVFDGTQPCCPVCLRGRLRAKRVRSLVLAAVGVAALGAAGVAVGWVVTREKPFDYGARAGEVRELSEALTKEPCDRAKIVKLADTMLRAGDNRGVLGRAGAFFQACGELPRLRWITFSAHKNLSEWDAAIADADKLIADRPHDQDFWWWRGQVYQQKGDLAHAEADMRKALEIMPWANYIPFDLADVLEKEHKPCEAAAVIVAYLQHHPDRADDDPIAIRLASLRQAGACP